MVEVQILELQVDEHSNANELLHSYYEVGSIVEDVAEHPHAIAQH